MKSDFNNLNAEVNEKFMRRALQLACNGEGRVSPNPMVGAVIVADNRIIGEGFHAFYGGPHAEVNAVRSVKPEDRDLLGKSTIYVTLEPCAHHGKTPPCADLIVKEGIPRVVIGSLDPNPLVAGKGVKILENAGISVTTGVLEEECKYLNRRFMTAQVSDRPWIILKWAQSSDGYLAALDDNGNPKSVTFSNEVSKVWMHRERANIDVIMVGGNTQRIENPKLTNRFWGGNSPQKMVMHNDKDLVDTLRQMRCDGVSSLMVEGGAGLLNSFIDSNLYDEIRVETSPILLEKGLKAPSLPQNIYLIDSFKSGGNLICRYGRL